MYNIKAVKYNRRTIISGSKNVISKGIKSQDSHSVKSTSMYLTKN